MTRIIKANATVDGDGDKAVVLNLADFAAEARSIILDARKDAARILAEARAKAESAERQARQRGYAEGFARGQNDGYADGRQQAIGEVGKKFADEYEQLLAQARTVVGGLAAARSEAMDRACGEILEMTILLAESVVGRIASTDIAAAKANLAKVMERVHGDGQILIKVNSAQLDSIREYFNELVDALGAGGEVKLVGDDQIASGGVKLISPHGQIDATIETQLANAARVLLGEDSRPARQGSKGLYRPVSSPEAKTTGDTADQAKRMHGRV